MINGLSHTCVYVLDQDEAKAFYTEKLGLVVREDITLGDYRWLTVGPKDRQDITIVLSAIGAPHFDEETAAQLRSVIAKGAMGPGVLTTDDCHKTFEELSAKGVEFVQEPADRPYGIEALFRDNSGNWFSLTQRRR
ncbi:MULTISPECIES: VOC family protein [unclassified Nonomuraea]|uniref:VOC family protein n=1 Tax=Nonomuraea sp. NPDC003804 TaxID=3154547 RepID=UPI0033AA8A43